MIEKMELDGSQSQKALSLQKYKIYLVWKNMFKTRARASMLVVE